MRLAEFKRPGAAYRLAPFWSWNDNLNPKELKRQIQEMADKGWGGFFMHSRVGLVTEYLSKEWMDMVKTCAKQAQAAGLYAWLYDEDKWPSGFAGGKVPQKDPSFRSRMLILLNPDEVEENDFPMMELDIDGDRKIICKRVSNLDNAWFNGTCYIDTMNPKAVEYFIECTHEEYKKECGEYFQKGIVGIFTDEPCYLRRSGIQQPLLPWSEELPDYFFYKKGYSIEEHLMELFYDIGEYQRIRFDFYDSVSMLFLESYTKQYYEWCDKNHIKMTGHLVAEDTMTAQVGRIGSAMPHYEFMHWPGIDKLGRGIDQPVTVKQLSSVSEQLGKERALCEAFGCIGQHTSFFHRKWIADWMAVLGVNYINPHLSLYSMRGERKRDYPPNFFYQQPWWGHEGKFADYIGRLCYAASQGKREVDILIIHPIASVWSEYSPLHRDNNFMKEREIYDAPFSKLTDALIGSKLDFHYGDETVMEAHASIRGDKLIIGQHQYSTVIVPPALTLRKSTKELLKKFFEVAGSERLIFMEPCPSRVDGREEDLSWIRGARTAKWASQVVDILEKIYPDRVRVVDKMAGHNCNTIICSQRSSSEGRWILMVNTDEKREVDANIILLGADKPFILDMFSGDIFEAPSEVLDGRVHIHAKFYPAGSILLYYPATSGEISAHQVPDFLPTGITFKGRSNIRTRTLDNWQVRFLEPNVLPLDKVTLYLDGERVLEDQPIFKAWNLFYKSPDGTNFRAEYQFNIVNVPNGPVFAAIEVAENLDRILLNGHPLIPLKAKGELGPFDYEKSWMDINFTKVPLGMYLQKGVNKLVIEGKKVNNVNGPGTHLKVTDPQNHRPTEVEAIYLVGNFNVKDDNGKRFFIDGNRSTPDPKNITASGYPFYAGKVEFIQNIVIDEPVADKVYIEITYVNAACIELYINGSRSSIRYWEPYTFEISELLKEGVNEIKVVAATTLFNLMGPNWNVDIMDIKRVGPNTFIDSSRYTEKYTLIPFGIGCAKLSL